MDDRRRLSFGNVASLYDRRRPSYPPELVDDVIALAGGVPLRALEVGAGTGKATALFAERGVEVDAVEPSAGMAAALRAKVGQQPGIAVIEAEFERLDPPATPYPLIYSAQAWHWIDPDRRYALAHAQLAPGGWLAAFWNQPRWDDVPVKEALDAVYARFAPDLAEDGPMRPGSRGGLVASRMERDIAEAADFDSGEVRLYEWDTTYTALEYTELLQTHSDHAILEPDRRARLLDAVAGVIDKAGGELEYGYVTRLFLLRAV